MTPLPKHLEEMRDELAEGYAYLNSPGGSWTAGYEDRKKGVELGFNQAASLMLKDLEVLAKALEFYTLKSNYSIVDEGRNYQVDYKCYELNEDTYADEELGTKAREALKNYREKYEVKK